MLRLISVDRDLRCNCYGRLPALSGQEAEINKDVLVRRLITECIELVPTGTRVLLQSHLLRCSDFGSKHFYSYMGVGKIPFQPC